MELSSMTSVAVASFVRITCVTAVKKTYRRIIAYLAILLDDIFVDQVISSRRIVIVEADIPVQVLHTQEPTRKALSDISEAVPGDK